MATHTHNPNQNEASSSKQNTTNLEGTTPPSSLIDPLRLVGLSPQFWAYTPLLIGDVHRLYLDPSLGLDCILYPPPSHASSSLLSSSQGVPPARKIPISKCKLTGVIVCAARKNNHVAYVLDDGTGCIDCIAWEEEEDNTLFPFLPPSFSSSTLQPRSHHHATRFLVGDVVQVYGRIKIVFIPPFLFQDPTIITPSSSDIPNAYSHVVREMDVNIMDYCDPADHTNHGYDPLLAPVSRTYTKGRGSQEISHWVQCLHLSRRIALQGSESSIESSNIESSVDNEEEEEDPRCSFLKRQLSKPIPTGEDMFSILPTNERNKIVHRSSSLFKNDKSIGHNNKKRSVHSNNAMENLDKKYGTTRLFGHSCPCNTTNGVTYKYHLLYCHCIATVVDIDPDLTFRDALLLKLIQMEGEYKKTLHQKNRTSSASELSHSTQYLEFVLKFSYQDICRDSNLLEIAKKILESSFQSKLDPTVLMRRTFFALREDGIVYLIDEILDEYIIISTESVLFPYIEMTLNPSSSLDDTLERIHLKKKRPDVLVKVSSERLQAAKNMFKLCNQKKRLEDDCSD